MAKKSVKSKSEVIPVDDVLKIEESAPEANSVEEVKTPDPVVVETSKEIESAPEVTTSKTYQLINGQKLSFSVQVGDKHIPITFANGIKSEALTINGKYRTSNKEVQDALENDSYFNVKYSLVKTQENTPVKESDYKKERLENKVVVLTVLNIQAAKKYLLDNFKTVKPEDLKNKNSILSMAEELNVSFPKIQ
jgi:hypothetical protein